MASTNLQYPLTSFIGREQDLALVEQRLSTARLVTLSGVGGCGKTRLAIQVAYSMLDRFTGGAWLVDLAPLHEPQLLPQLVAQTLGLRPAPDLPPLETLQHFFHTRQILLILDNCEHLTQACAQLAHDLLSQAPGLRILATSREVLGVAGEAIYPLSGLAWPAPTSETGAAGQILDYDAIRLFSERARSSATRFILTAENAPAVIEICRRLDGLPLAIELASARVNILTVEEIAHRLDGHLGGHLNGRFTLLSAGPRSGNTSRHTTLRAAIDWSYNLLPPPEQMLLRRLAVFETGCTLDAAEAICADPSPTAEPVIAGISALVSKSLVVADTIDRTQARYRMLETIREYALEKLEEAGETTCLRDHHLDYYLARAEEAEPKLNDAYQQLWLNWLEGEHDNLRAALAWALERGEIEKGLRIAIAIIRFWEIRGYVDEGLAWLKSLLGRADAAVSPVIRAHALSYAAFLAMFLGDAPATLAFGREAVAIAETTGEEGLAVLNLALGGLASAARIMGDYQTAFDIGERSIQILRKTADQSMLLGMSLLAEGSIAMELGLYDTARSQLEESLALAQVDGDRFRIAHALNALGDLARCETTYAGALAHYERSAALLRELNAQRDLASVLRNLGHACLHLGNIERAHTLFCESIAIQQALQNMPGVAECLISFAAIAILQDMPAAGARLIGASTAVGGKRVNVATAWRATRMEYENYRDLARTRLGEPVFLAEQALGQALTLEQALHFALNLPGKAETAAPDKKTSEILTNREREVALLIGQGKTNGEIAAQLVLSKRTVETHINNILAKLHLSSRPQIMRWSMEK